MLPAHGNYSAALAVLRHLCVTSSRIRPIVLGAWIATTPIPRRQQVLASDNMTSTLDVALMQVQSLVEGAGLTQLASALGRVAKSKGPRKAGTAGFQRTVASGAG